MISAPDDTSEQMKYPAEFHFRVICEAAFDISGDIHAAAAGHKITRSFAESNNSRSGKYRSFSISVVFKERAEMVRFDQAVKAIPGVRILL